MNLGPTTVNYIKRNAAGTTSRQGIQQTTDAAPVVITGCRLDIERGSDEELEGRDTITSRAILFVPPSDTYAIGPLDAFTIGGDLWEVNGNPRLIDSHVGPHHYEITVLHFQR